MAPTNRADNGDKTPALPRVLVLIFDADEATRHLYHRELSRHYDVLLCTNEQEARQILRTANIQALVLEPAALNDEQWSFVSLLRTTAAYQHVAIIICSTLDQRRRGAAFDVNAYLIKPVSASLLLQTVAAVLNEPALTRRTT